MSLTVNRLIRRKLRLSLILLIGYVAVDLAPGAVWPSICPDTQKQLAAFGKLAFAAALINAAVFLLVNPLRADRVPDRFPIILQDAIVIGLICWPDLSQPGSSSRRPRSARWCSASRCRTRSATRSPASPSRARNRFTSGTGCGSGTMKAAWRK